MNRFKKATAMTLAAALVLGSSMTAFAADTSEGGNLGGTGGLEGSAETDVFSVVLPTVTDTDPTFNYILDPEGLIAATAGVRYPDAEFEAGSTLFFQNTKGDTDPKTPYTNKSDALTIVNKSTMDVDVTLKATVAAIDGITMTSDNTFADDTKASLYLALMDGTNTEAIDATIGAKISASIPGAPSDAYEMTYTAQDGYKYALTDAAKAADYAGFEDYSFQLTGACNTAGSWSGLTDIAPEVDVTWNVKAHSDDPGHVLESDGTGDVVIYYTGSKPATITVTPKSITGSNTAAMDKAEGTDVVITDSTVTIKGTWLIKLIDNATRGTGIYTVSFNGETFDITLTK